MLQNDFVPVAIDQWYQRQQQDAEGEFYRKVAGQGLRQDFEKTTQGRYICSPDGVLHGYNNNRGADRVRLMMKVALANFDPETVKHVEPIDVDRPDGKFFLEPPAGGLILRVQLKNTGRLSTGKRLAGCLPRRNRTRQRLDQGQREETTYQLDQKPGGATKSCGVTNFSFSSDQ